MTKPDSMLSGSTGPRGDKIGKHLPYNSSYRSRTKGRERDHSMCVGQQLHTEIVTNAINVMKSHFI